MLQTARTEAAAHGVDNITFSAPGELFAGQKRFDFVVCYLVLQRLAPREGLALVRALIERVVSGGIGVFQFPYRTEASSLVNGTRWLREHVRAVNGLTNTLRRQPWSQPFMPTHMYQVEAVLKIFDAAACPATYLTFEDHGDVASMLAFTERPMSARLKPTPYDTRSARPAADNVGSAKPSGERSEPIDVKS